MQRRGKESLKLDKANRSPRFPLETPCRFRKPGQIDWLQGMTANVSKSGILFRADREMEVQTTLQMNFELPAEIAGGRGAEVFCMGKVVRTVMPAANDDKLLLAARLLASKDTGLAEDETVLQ
jgi:hypothetical protein